MGGLAGHMMHPHDNLELKTSQFIKMCTESLRGHIRFREKVDGINIHIFREEDGIRFARSRKDLEAGGFTINDFETRIPEAARGKFIRGWQMVQEMDILDIPIFSVSHRTLNAEILLETGANILQYTSDQIVKHNYWQWEKQDNKWVVIEIEPITREALNYTPDPWLNADYVEQEIKDVIGPEHAIANRKDLTLAQYYFIRFSVIMTQRGYTDITGSEALLTLLFRRFFKYGPQTNLKIIRQFVSDQTQLNKALDEAADIVRAVKYELERIVLMVGTRVLGGISGHINDGCFSPAALVGYKMTKADKDKWNNWRWDTCDHRVFGLEGVVFEWDGQTYKWTGPFAPINQALSVCRK